MKVYVVFIQNKVYQEIGNVHTSMKEAKKEIAKIQSVMNLSSSEYPGAVVIERELIQEMDRYPSG